MKTFYEKVYENIKENPEKEILIGKRGGKYYPITYGDFKKQVTSLQEALKDLSKEDRAVIFMENRPEWISSFYAVIFKGGIAVPVDYLLSSEELFNIFKDSQPRYVITSSQNEGKVREAVKDIGYHVKVINVDKDLRPPTNSLEFVDRNEEDVLVILYTSGTTGNPKGVMLTLGNLDHNVKAVEKLGFLNDKDRFIAILPFHHTYPLMTTVLLPLS
ncbi:MAG: class I adenylate-forming enzyme family protein, partial [Desulfurobacteriaceae bacterium]